MSEDCQTCGTAMWDLDEEGNCPACSNSNEGRCICAATNPFECSCGGWDDVNLEDYEDG